MRNILVVTALALALASTSSAQVTGGPSAHLLVDSAPTPLVPIIPQTRTAHSRIVGSNVAQFAVFPGQSASARVPSNASFLVTAQTGVQPQSLVTLATLSVQRRHNMRDIYIGGGQGGYAIHSVQVVPMVFEVAPDQSGAPGGATVYKATPIEALRRGEYILVMVTPGAPTPYGGMPATYFDFGVD